jgi:prevent-host-death family protein
MKKTAAVAELKAQLSRYLSRVKSGEEILVTERGTPVARLVPVHSGEASDTGLQDLERQGLVRLGTGRLPGDFWKLPRPRDRRAAVRKAVTEERDTGW